MRKGQPKLSLLPDMPDKLVTASQQVAAADGEETPTDPAALQDSPTHPHESSVPCTLRLGAILMKHGLITDVQLQEALHIQQTLKTYKPIGQILIEQKALTPIQLTLYLEKYRKQLQLSDVLIKTHLITESQLRIAVERQQQTGLPLGTVLLQLNYISEEALKQALCLQLNIPFVDLDRVNLDRSLARLLNKSYAQRHYVIPISRVGTTLTVAVEDPTDTEVVRDLQASTGYTINMVTATHHAIRQALGRIYDIAEEKAEGIEHLDLAIDSPVAPTSKSKYVEEYHENRRADEIVKHLIALAISHRASDIHFDPVDQHMHIRFRIDGILQELYLGALEDDINANQGAVVSRIKILGKLDIAE
jgi:type IV pilus assembly protein PilB